MISVDHELHDSQRHARQWRGKLVSLRNVGSVAAKESCSNPRLTHRRDLGQPFEQSRQIVRVGQDSLVDDIRTKVGESGMEVLVVSRAQVRDTGETDGGAQLDARLAAWRS